MECQGWSGPVEPGLLEMAPNLTIDSTAFGYGGTEDFFGNQFYEDHLHGERMSMASPATSARARPITQPTGRAIATSRSLRWSSTPTWAWSGKTRPRVKHQLRGWDLEPSITPKTEVAAEAYRIAAIAARKSSSKSSATAGPLAIAVSIARWATGRA